MGLGPDTKKDLTVKQRLFPEHGTLAQLWKLQAKEKKKAASAKEGGGGDDDNDEEGMLLELPRGKYPDLDKFEDILEAGSRVAARSRQLLVMFPTVVLFMCMGATFWVCVSVASKTTGEHGLSPFEFIDQNAWMLQVVLVVLSMVFAFLVAALQPTFTRAIANVVFAFLAYFVGCGLVVCPYAMPMMLPDKTGTVALIWQICGYVKCMVVIAVLTYSVCQHPPRRVLRILEWTLMIVIVAIGLFVAMSCYYVVVDNLGEAAIDASFFAGWATSTIGVIATGVACVTSVPRTMGKRLLKALAWHTEPGASYEHQVLASTIATMIGVDAKYRAVMMHALRNFRGVSMADITWEEFAESTPNPKCFLKSKLVAFKEIDFFISHSWSDDPAAKWEAIQGMRRTFKAKHKREPIVWFDKYCIDQEAIDESVRRLPIFVVGSSKFLVLLGPSYASRCWCMLELFVFNSVRECALFDEKTDLVVMPLAGAQEELKELTKNFDIVSKTKKACSLSIMVIFASIALLLR